MIHRAIGLALLAYGALSNHPVIQRLTVAFNFLLSSLTSTSHAAARSADSWAGWETRTRPNDGPDGTIYTVVEVLTLDNARVYWRKGVYPPPIDRTFVRWEVIERWEENWVTTMVWRTASEMYYPDATIQITPHIPSSHRSPAA